MRNCSAAIIMANEENQISCGGNYRLTDEFLSEIIAAYVMFESRVLMIWQGSSLPSIALKKLKTSHIKSDVLGWDTGLEIGQIIKEFKSIFLKKSLPPIDKSYREFSN